MPYSKSKHLLRGKKRLLESATQPCQKSGITFDGIYVTYKFPTQNMYSYTQKLKQINIYIYTVYINCLEVALSHLKLARDPHHPSQHFQVRRIPVLSAILRSRVTHKPHPDWEEGTVEVRAREDDLTILKETWMNAKKGIALHVTPEYSGQLFWVFRRLRIVYGQIRVLRLSRATPKPTCIASRCKKNARII